MLEKQRLLHPSISSTQGCKLVVLLPPWGMEIRDGEPLQGIRTRTLVRVCNIIIFAVSYKDNLEAF